MPQQFHQRCRVGILFKERRLLLRTQSTIRRLSAETVMQTVLVIPKSTSCSGKFAKLVKYDNSRFGSQAAFENLARSTSCFPVRVHKDQQVLNCPFSY